MKKIALVAVTLTGTELLEKIYYYYPEGDFYTNQQWLDRGWEIPQERFFGYSSLKNLITKIYGKYHGFIMVTALGIVFRTFAPHIKDKYTDPAVVVVDERGKNVISVLSGHLGGANDLCRQLAQYLQANPVITTATDVNGLFAFDSIARKYNLKIENPISLKKFNSALLQGEGIKVYIDSGNKILQDLKSNGTNIEIRDIEEYLETKLGKELCCVITNKNSVFDQANENLLVMRPRNIVLGIGCRRGVAAATIRELITEQMDKLNLSQLSIKAIATISLKEDEEGLNQIASEYGVDLLCFTREEIENVCEEIKITASDFVKAKVGVSCVCEPAAILGGNKVKLILKKTAREGVTLAVGEESLP
ncbi:cobalt-precorrin 5A hydrolase [Desulfitispora alkaliphila]|uniref:cobalt-precorrin 5A hydrolase n=1 Tax=Desulfitispora alkaliphila TaxID=622674 RepID=UPI003D1C8BF8